jgi:hypothetical protein
LIYTTRAVANQFVDHALCDHYKQYNVHELVFHTNILYFMNNGKPLVNEDIQFNPNGVNQKTPFEYASLYEKKDPFVYFKDLMFTDSQLNIIIPTIDQFDVSILTLIGEVWNDREHLPLFSKISDYIYNDPILKTVDYPLNIPLDLGKEFYYNTKFEYSETLTFDNFKPFINVPKSFMFINN